MPRNRLILAVIAALVALLVASQLLLPGVAEDRLRSDLEENGEVRRLEIDALPALAVLWQRADRVELEMDGYETRGSPGQEIADRLADTSKAGKVDARIDRLDAGPLALSDVHVTKDGDTLVGTARVTESGLVAALPGFADVRPVEASEEGIVLEARAGILGVGASVRVRVEAEDGRIVVRPRGGGPLASLATITVFDDERITVHSLSAHDEGEGYVLEARGTLE